MKKIFTFLLMFVGIFTIVQLGARAETSETIDFSAQSYDNAKDMTESAVSLTNATLTFSKGTNSNTPKYYTSGTAIRMYGGNTVTISALNDLLLTGIVITFGSSDGSNTISVSNGTLVDNTWTNPLGTTEVVITIDGTTGQRRIQKLALTLVSSDEISDVTMYTVNFNMNDGTETVVKTYTMASGSDVVFPENPLRSGYTFLGWYDAAEDGNKVTELTLNANTELYAHWSQDSYTLATIDTTNFLALTEGTSYANWNGEHELTDHFKYTSNQAYITSGVIQFQKSTGYMYNSSMVTGYIAKITMSVVQGSFSIYSSTTPILDVPASATGTFENGIYTPNNSSDTYFRIVNGSSTGQVNWISVSYTYDDSIVEKYSVSYNVNGGTFADGKGETITEVVGTDTVVTLPTASDLTATPYNYTTLVGWTDGTTTYEPGTELTISDSVVFKAVYEASADVTVEEALEICGLTGSTNTICKFTTLGTITSIDTTYSSSYNNITVTITDSTGSSIKVFRLSGGADLSVGDVIKVTGYLVTYGSTPEYVSSTYTVNSHVVGVAFKEESTMASLRVVYDETSLEAEKIYIRFGGIISADSYNANAKYGVIIVDSASSLDNVDVSLLAEEGYAVECTAVAVDGGYQFAWVIDNIDSENYDYEFRAVMYMQLGDNLYLAEEKVASVDSVVATYLENSDVPEAVKTVLGKLN